MKRLVVLAVGFLALAATAFAQASLSALIKRVQPAVVTVIAYDADDRVTQQGTGFFVGEDGALLTNQHVVSGALRLVVRMEGGDERAVDRVVVEDASADLALLAIDFGKEKAAALRFDPRPPEIGDRIFVVSSPLWLDQTVSEGIIAAVGRDLPDMEDMLQITAPISPGSSGAPVLNMEGRVIGIVTAQILEGQNLNFAIPAARALAFLGRRGGFGSPPDRETPFGRGLTHFRRRRYEDALREFTSAAEAEPDSRRIAFFLGTTYLRLGRYEEALTALRRATESGAPRPIVHVVLGDAYLALGRTEEAIAAYERARQGDPGFPLATVKLGRAYIETERFSEAVKVLESALKEGLDSANVRLLLGRAEAGLGRYEAAIAAFVEAIRRRPEDIEAHYALGMAYLAVGRRDRALDEFTILKRLDADRANTLFDAIYP